MDRNARPNIIPSKIKLIILGSFLILINSFNESTQNNNKNISVLKINDEKLTAGIEININPQNKELVVVRPIFLHKS